MAIARRIRIYDTVISSIVADRVNDGGGDSLSSDRIEGTVEIQTLTGEVLKELKEECIVRLRNGRQHDVRTNQSLSKGGNCILEGRAEIYHGIDFHMSNPVGGELKISNASGKSQTLVLPVQTALSINDPNNKSRSKPTTKSLDSSCSGRILMKTMSDRGTNVPTPKWHAPWKLSAVLSSHLGWVRSIAFDPTNDMFATGSADRTIKIFDFAKSCVGADDALKITLTGHISPVRGLAFSPRYPYLFSVGEDKMVKCWDLETNQVVRNYHGHLSGVFEVKIHPELDLLVTGGRDAVARIWDMRTKQQVHCLTGHDNTVGALLTKSTDPQVITGSYDSTIKLWDLAAGKCMSTLTHHKKSVRALVQPSFENTFLSSAADALKKWRGRDGSFIKNFTGHKAVINAVAINDNGVLVSAADDGTMGFWDYGTGYRFQLVETIAQPGSLEAENGIYAVEFDLTNTRLITGEADKTIKIWKQDEDASDVTHPVDITAWRKKCISNAQQRY